LADRLHVSDRTVSKWERGAGFPDVSLMIGLSDLLGISVNELLEGEQNPGKDYTEETQDQIKEAARVIYHHVHMREKKLRGRIIAGVVVLALFLLAVDWVIGKVEENLILFPPRIECELLQRDRNVEATLVVDRRNTGVYDYVRSYTMDRYGKITRTAGNLWQSYTDAVSAEVYKKLRDICPGEITSIDKTETGYLICAYQNPVTAVITQTDASLNPVFRYEFDAEEGLSTLFLSEDTLYIVNFHGTEGRTYVTAVNKITGRERVSSFAYCDFVPDCGEKDSMGGFLFDRANMWVKEGILYFAETYYKGPSVSVFGAYDLEENKAVCFEIIENSHVVMVRKEPEKGQVAVLLNPMDYHPLELYTLDDRTMEIKSVTQIELPNEYLTRRDSEYAAEQYYLSEGDMDEDKVAVLFGDTISRKDMDDDTFSNILVIYDRVSGRPVWRGRLMMDIEYEIDDISLKAAE